MAWNLDSSPTTRIPHIALCVPHHGHVPLEWVESTYGPLRFIRQPDFLVSNKLARGVLNLDTERNLLARYALEDKTVTHILWLDTDTICESPRDPNDALRMLLNCNVPVVSGLYRSKKSKGEYPYAMWMKNPKEDNYLPIAKWTGNWLKVDAIGMGFCLMKREVFEKIPPPWFVWDKPDGVSEDFAFCRKLIDHEYEIRVFTDIRLSHAGEMKVRSDGSIHLLDV
jgi:GT2 family glycosyltransferase